MCLGIFGAAISATRKGRYGVLNLMGNVVNILSRFYCSREERA
jgi:hypothetical protein